MLCYFCSMPSHKPFCSACFVQMQPRFRLLPAMPNICLGGYLYSYTPVIRFIMHDVKFRGNQRLLSVFKSQLLNGMVPPIFFDSDSLVLVRSHWLRQLFRGPSHLRTLLAPLVQMADRSLDTYLARHRYSRSSYLLNRMEREAAHAVHRFSWNGPSHIRSVTIFDDICTTGSTLIEIARLLKSQGIDTVKVLVVSYVD